MGCLGLNPSQSHQGKSLPHCTRAQGPLLSSKLCKLYLCFFSITGRKNIISIEIIFESQPNSLALDSFVQRTTYVCLCTTSIQYFFTEATFCLPNLALNFCCQVNLSCVLVQFWSVRSLKVPRLKNYPDSTTPFSRVFPISEPSLSTAYELP